MPLTEKREKAVRTFFNQRKDLLESILADIRIRDVEFAGALHELHEMENLFPSVRWPERDQITEVVVGHGENIIEFPNIGGQYLPGALGGDIDAMAEAFCCGSTIGRTVDSAR
jgi:hypothetical protein